MIPLRDKTPGARRLTPVNKTRFSDRRQNRDLSNLELSRLAAGRELVAEFAEWCHRRQSTHRRNFQCAPSTPTNFARRQISRRRRLAAVDFWAGDHEIFTSIFSHAAVPGTSSAHALTGLFFGAAVRVIEWCAGGGRKRRPFSIGVGELRRASLRCLIAPPPEVSRVSVIGAESGASRRFLGAPNFQLLNPRWPASGPIFARFVFVFIVPSTFHRRFPR